MAKGLDRLAQQALVATLPAPPGLRRHGRAWLRSGIMAADVGSPTTAGTPQGGRVSPRLARIARHGMDTASPQVDPEARVMADADDGMVLPEARSVLAHGQPLCMTGLAAIGLTRHVTTTPIRHTWAGEQPGMDWLGCHSRP
jgi:hypothetical protein